MDALGQIDKIAEAGKELVEWGIWLEGEHLALVERVKKLEETVQAICEAKVLVKQP